MRRLIQGTKSLGRAALLVPLAALAAAGCTSTAPSVAGPAVKEMHSAGPPGGPGVPATAYVSVVQNYGVPEHDGAPGQWRYTVTDRQAIAQLAALVDTLKVAKAPAVNPCTSSGGPAFELEFLNAKGGKPVAQVDLECFGIVIDVGGHDKPVGGLPMPSGKLDFIRKMAAILAPYAPKAG